MIPRLCKKIDRKGLLFSNLLKCRQVCSLWNAIVDKRLNRKFIRARLTNIMSQPRSKTGNDFDSSQSFQVSKFLKHFEGTHGKPEVIRNPFIWSNLSVLTVNAEDGLTDGDQEFIDTVSSVIRKYGRFIHDFKLEIYGFAFYVEDCLRLQDWLAHMPNLRSLDIFDKTPSYEGNLSLFEFEDQLVTANFPAFKKLKHLKSVKFERLRAPIFNRFIQQNDHISRLLLTKCEQEYNYFALPFQNLNSFEINIDSVETFEKLQNSSHVQWAMLENLTILFSPDESSSCFVPLAQIFQVIQTKFGNKLETIYLELPKARNDAEADSLWMDSVNCRLDLPNLFGVRLTLKDPLSLDFLLETKHMLEDIFLEILYPIRGKKLNGRNSTIVQFNGFEKKIRASNIPTLFTKLERIGVYSGIGLRKRTKWYHM